MDIFNIKRVTRHYFFCSSLDQTFTVQIFNSTDDWSILPGDNYQRVLNEWFGEEEKTRAFRGLGKTWK